MPSLRQGTRKFTGIRREQTPEMIGQDKYSLDKGLKTRILPASATFLASSAQIKGSLGDFSGTFGSSLVAPQPVRIRGTAKNNGERLATAITVASNAEYMTIAQGVKAEGPIATASIRTP